MKLNRWAREFLEGPTIDQDYAKNNRASFRIKPENPKDPEARGKIGHIIPDLSFIGTSFAGHFGALEMNGSIILESLWTNEEMVSLAEELLRSSRLIATPAG